MSLTIGCCMIHSRRHITKDSQGIFWQADYLSDILETYRDANLIDLWSREGGDVSQFLVGVVVLVAWVGLQ